MAAYLFTGLCCPFVTNEWETDKCEADLGLACDHICIWQPVMYPHPPVWPLTWILKSVYLHINVSPRFWMSWHYGACWWWQVHLTLAEKFHTRPTSCLHTFFFLLETAFSFNYCTSWMTGWFRANHTHFILNPFPQHTLKGWVKYMSYVLYTSFFTACLKRTFLFSFFFKGDPTVHNVSCNSKMHIY